MSETRSVSGVLMGSDSELLKGWECYYYARAKSGSEQMKLFNEAEESFQCVKKESDNIGDYASALSGLLLLTLLPREAVALYEEGMHTIRCHFYALGYSAENRIQKALLEFQVKTDYANFVKILDPEMAEEIGLEALIELRSVFYVYQKHIEEE